MKTPRLILRDAIRGLFRFLESPAGIVLVIAFMIAAVVVASLTP